jgi:hypothetical protein
VERNEITILPFIGNYAYGLSYGKMGASRSSAGGDAEAGTTGGGGGGDDDES